MNATAPLSASYDPLGYIDTGIRMENYGYPAVSRAKAIIAPERTADRDAYSASVEVPEWDAAAVLEMSSRI